MRKFIVLAGNPRLGIPEGACHELSPLTHEEFVALDHWVGDSDTSWNYFKRHNHMHEIDSFNEEALLGSRIELLSGEPAIDWSIVYGHEATACWHNRCERCNNMPHLTWDEVRREGAVMTPGGEA